MENEVFKVKVIDTGRDHVSQGLSLIRNLNEGIVVDGIAFLGFGERIGDSEFALHIGRIVEGACRLPLACLALRFGKVYALNGYDNRFIVQPVGSDKYRVYLDFPKEVLLWRDELEMETPVMVFN